MGTLFALCAESGLDPAIRKELLTELGAGKLVVRTDPLASPTGFPFKVATLPGTMSEAEVYAARPRLCDLSYLRVPYEREPGDLGYRCPAEPVHMYVKKGGDLADTVGRKCLCNGLTAGIGLGQTRRDGYQEVPIVTLGADLDGVARCCRTCLRAGPLSRPSTASWAGEGRGFFVFWMERATGIEPALSVWKTGALPLSYARVLRPL